MNNDTKNVNELSESQKVLKGKIDRIREIMNEEPRAVIVPFLRFTPNGILPDAKLSLAHDIEPTDEGESGKDDNSSEVGPTGEQSPEPQAA